MTYNEASLVCRFGLPTPNFVPARHWVQIIGAPWTMLFAWDGQTRRIFVE